MSQSGFWAKALPEEFANEGNVIAFWVDKKGRVFYRINESSPMLFFSGVRTAEPLWALIDVYGLTRGVQLLGENKVAADCMQVALLGWCSHHLIKQINVFQKVDTCLRGRAPHLHKDMLLLPESI